MTRLLLAAGALWCGSAAANVVWRGDFETHDLSQYDSYVVHGERWTFVTASPAPREGRYAARVELQSGDVGPSNLIRTEVGHTPPFASFEGSERYYAWSAMGSTDFPLGAFDHQIMFWECDAPVYQQEMSLHVDGTAISFATSPQGGQYQTRWTGAFSFGVWHDFILHVKWSLDAAVGFVELWYDGTIVVPKFMMKTMHASGTTPIDSTMHHGLFLGAARANKPVEVIYLDAAREGTTLADVQPVSMPDAGAGGGTAGGSGGSGGSGGGAAGGDAGGAMGGGDAGGATATGGGAAVADAGTDRGTAGSCGCDGTGGALGLGLWAWAAGCRRRRARAAALGVAALMGLAALVGCKKDAAPGLAPAPVAATAKLLPEDAEVEVTGSLSGIEGLARITLVISKEPCTTSPSALTVLARFGLEPAPRFFAEVFVPQGTVGHLCALGRDAEGQVTRVGAYAKNPATLSGAGEVELRDVAIALEPLAAPVKPPVGL